MKRRSASGSQSTTGIHAVGAGLEVGVRAPHRLWDELLLGPGSGAGEERAEEDVDPRVDHEPVAVSRRGLPNRHQPLRLPVGIAEAAGGVVGVLEIAAGGSGAPQRSRPARRAASRSRPRRRPSRARRRPARSARPRRASRRRAHPRGPHIRARRPRRRWWSRPRGTRPRRRLSPWPRPRRSEQERGAGTVQRPQQVAPALEVGCVMRTSLRRASCREHVCEAPCGW